MAASETRREQNQRLYFETKNKLLGALVRRYVAAEKAFHSDRDAHKSSIGNYSDPVGHARRSWEFFGAREELRFQCANFPDDVARLYAQRSEEAEECPTLVNQGKGDEAARRMVLLGEAEKALIEKYKDIK